MKKKKEEKVPDPRKEDLGEEGLEDVIAAITKGVGEGGFGACHVQLMDGLGVDATKSMPSHIVMTLGTFRIELSDGETSLLDKMQLVISTLQCIKDLGWRPDKMVSDGAETPEGMYQ